MVVFFSMMNVAGINVLIMYLTNGNDVPYRSLFLRQLVRELINGPLKLQSTYISLHRLIPLRIREILCAN